MPSPRCSMLAEIPAPDGGWGWLVLAGAFTVYFVCDGIENTFGLLAAEIIDELGTSRQTIGWIVSLKCASMYFVCPLSALLCRLTDVRLVGALAGFLAFLGFFSASFASQAWHLFITAGIVTGPGVGTCFLICLVTVCQYFERLRATATGMALCGSGLGGLILSPLVAYLIGSYGWNGTLLLLSALYLHTLPCCLLMRPLEAPGKSPRQQEELGKPSTSEGCVNSGDSPVTSSPVSSHNTESVITVDEVAAAFTENPAPEAERNSLRAAAWLANSTLSPIFLLPAHFYASSRPQTEHNSTLTDGASKICQRPRRGRNPSLLVFHASRLLLAAAVPAFFAYIADHFRRLGFSQGKAAALLSILSGCSMAGRLAFGCLGDRDFASPLALYGLALLVGGSLVGASLAANSFGALAACLGLAWIFVGGAVSLTTLVTVYLDGTRRLFSAFARQSIFQGVGVLIGPPLAGAIYDRMGNYLATLAFIGASLFASALLVLGIYLLKRVDSASQTVA